MAKKKTRSSSNPPAAAGPPGDAEGSTSPQPQRALSPYNQYMKMNVGRLKREDPSLNHKDAFRAAASAWGTAPENPKADANKAAAAAGGGVKKPIKKGKGKKKTSADEGATTAAATAAAAAASNDAAAAATAELAA